MEEEKYNFPTEDNPPFPSRFRGVEDEDRPNRYGQDNWRKRNEEQTPPVSA